MMKRGRKRLPDDLRKTEAVRVALTVTEYQSLVGVAESLGMTMSGLAREIVVGALIERKQNGTV